MASAFGLAMIEQSPAELFAVGDTAGSLFLACTRSVSYAFLDHSSEPGCGRHVWI